MTIEVTVKADGTYSCTPATKEKKKGKGSITWEMKTDGWHFVEPGVTWGTQTPAGAPAPNTVFTNTTVKAKKITVDDDNQNGSGSSNYDYPYTLSIAADSPAHGRGSPSLEKSSEIIRNTPT